MNIYSYAPTKHELRGVRWARETASVFKILADPTRCRILKLLVHNTCGMCVGEIADTLGVSHSAASHQLNGLEDQEVLVSIRDGQSVCYELADTPIACTIANILDMFPLI